MQRCEYQRCDQDRCKNHRRDEPECGQGGGVTSSGVSIWGMLRYPEGFFHNVWTVNRQGSTMVEYCQPWLTMVDPGRPGVDQGRVSIRVDEIRYGFNLQTTFWLYESADSVGNPIAPTTSQHSQAYASGSSWRFSCAVSSRARACRLETIVYWQPLQSVTGWGEDPGNGVVGNCPHGWLEQPRLCDHGMKGS